MRAKAVDASLSCAAAITFVRWGAPEPSATPRPSPAAQKCKAPKHSWPSYGPTVMRAGQVRYGSI